MGSRTCHSKPCCTCFDVARPTVHPTIEVVHEINKTVKMLSRCADLKWRYFKIADGIKDVVIGVSSGAAWANRPDRASQGGWMAWMSSKKIYTGDATPINIVNFTSRRLQRVARITYSADTHGLCNAGDALEALKMWWRMVMHKEVFFYRMLDRRCYIQNQ